MYHPDFGLPVNYSVEVIGDDPEEQVARTVELMGRYVREDLSDPLLLSAAAKLHGETQAKTARNVWDFVHGLMRFQEDQETAAKGAGLSSPGYPVVEVLIRPRDVLDVSVRGGNQNPVGDCDDFTMLAAALLAANGIHCNFVTAAHELGEDRFSHIYAAAYVDGERLVLDASHGGALGEEHPSHRIKEWSLMGPGCLVLVALAVAISVFYLLTEEEGGEL